jgi:predicted RNA-binding protein with PUA-like domain
MPKRWLMKSEPSEASVDDFAAAPGQTLAWTGVRNYQARNFMRDEMNAGDGVLFFHSSCPQPGIVGLARIAGHLAPDATQFDPRNAYFDAKATLQAPRWVQIDVHLLRKTRLLSLAEMRQAPALATMQVLRRGNRLSITPVSEAEWQAVLELLSLPRSGSQPA